MVMPQPVLHRCFSLQPWKHSCVAIGESRQPAVWPPTSTRILQTMSSLDWLRHPPPETELRRRSVWWRLTLPLIGLLCLGLAALGAVLPIIPGVLFLALGVPLLAAVHPRLEAWVRRIWYRWLRRGILICRRLLRFWRLPRRRSQRQS